MKRLMLATALLGLAFGVSAQQAEPEEDVRLTRAERAAANDVLYVDVWDGFVNEGGEFVTMGPALDGQTRRLRIADGVHFTRAGARKIGHSVELELRTYLAPKDAGDNMSELAGFDSTAPTVPGSSRILLLGQAPRAPGDVVVRARPTPCRAWPS